jgi:HSP20 family protein
MANKDTPSPLLPQQLSQVVDQLFDHLIHRPWGVRRAGEEEWNPQLDLYETEADFILEADLPGVREQDVSVTVKNSDLVLQGQRVFERVTTDENFHCHERRAGRFVRRLRLPASVDRERIQAKFHDGVLHVTLPKRQRERIPT